MPADVAIVDWLGRGGIAQTTEAWAISLRQQSSDEVAVLTRPGREIVADGPGCAEQSRSGPVAGVAAHLDLSRRVAAWIRSHEPRTVVIQNYVIPALEWPVYRAAKSVGARIVLVIHDHQPHSRLSGSTAGLSRMLDAADVVICHTDFVAGRVHQACERITPEIVPHPLPAGLLLAERPNQLLETDDRPTAVHLGVLKRRYKGTDTIEGLASSMIDWRFVLMGTGAPTMTNATTLSGFRPAGEIVQAMSESDVALLPYRIASQSGVVVLAQAMGTVPIVHAVGGLPEQVRDGVDGLVLPLDSGVAGWKRALAGLQSSERRLELTANGLAAVQAADRAFHEAVRAVVA